MTTNYRLMQEHEVPDYVRITKEDLEVDITKEYGAGKRERKQVKYNDDMTDHQWLNQMLDEPEEEKKSQKSQNSSNSTKRQKIGDKEEQQIDAIPKISTVEAESAEIKSEKSNSASKKREIKEEEKKN